MFEILTGRRKGSAPQGPDRPRRLSATLLIVVLALACAGPDRRAPSTPVVSPTGAGAPAPAAAAAAMRTGPASTALPPATATAVSTLRGLDWRKVLLADPELTDSPGDPQTSMGPPVALKPGSALGIGGGLAMVDEVLYVDMSGDGREEAVISLHSGGTAGVSAFLVYELSAGKPALRGSIAGYKLGRRPEGGRLLVVQGIYTTGDPNCCPSGWKDSLYELRSSKLNLVSQSEYGNPDRRATAVADFYGLIRAKRFAEAYKLLTPRLAATQPFEAWQAGYAATLGLAFRLAEAEDGTVVVVEIVSKEDVRDARNVRHFSGRWSLLWSFIEKRWLLDSSSFRECPRMTEDEVDLLYIEWRYTDRFQTLAKIPSC